MDKLEERFGKLYWGPHECASKKEIYEGLAKEAKEIAIEFAKHILHSKVTKHTSANDEGTTEWPFEYQMLLGQLIKDNSLMWNEFIEERYER